MNGQLASFTDTAPNWPKQTFLRLVLFPPNFLKKIDLFQGASSMRIFAVETEAIHRKLGVVSHEAETRRVKLLNARKMQVQYSVLSSS
jgi:hypothetical protein